MIEWVYLAVYIWKSFKVYCSGSNSLKASHSLSCNENIEGKMVNGENSEQNLVILVDKQTKENVSVFSVLLN